MSAVIYRSVFEVRQLRATVSDGPVTEIVVRLSDVTRLTESRYDLYDIDTDVYLLPRTFWHFRPARTRQRTSPYKLLFLLSASEDPANPHSNECSEH